MRIIFLTCLALLLCNCVTTTSKKNNNFSKLDLVLPAITIVNPAIAFSSFIASSNSIHKVLTLGNLAYSTTGNNTIAEEALSQAIKKDCKFKNLAEKNNLCL